MEVGGIPPVSRGTVNQHKVRMTVLQLYFQPIVDEDFLLLSSQDSGILKRQVRWVAKLIHDPTDLIRLPQVIPLEPIYLLVEEDDLCEDNSEYTGS